MTAAAPTGATAFADELREVAPEVADAFDAAFAELMGQALPAWDDHLAGLLATGEVLAAPPGDEEGSGEVVPFARPRRRVARRAVVVGGAVTVVIAATTGLAAASALPAPVQRAVAEVASHVGIGLPSPRPEATVRADATTTTPAAPTTVAATTTVAPPTTTAAPASTGAAGRNGSAATSPAPVTASPGPDRAGLLAAVAAFRACLAGSERGARDCTPPDPAAFGFTAATEPAEIGAFRAALGEYRACLRAARSSEARAACVRPDPAAYGFGKDASAPSPPTGTAPSAAVDAFRQAVATYGTCITAARTPEQFRACVPPNPYDFGLSAWPPGLTLPRRSAATSRPAASSPPVDVRPPARTPGATGSSADSDRSYQGGRRSPWSNAAPSGSSANGFDRPRGR